MKFVAISLVLLMSANSFASTKLKCATVKAFQVGEANMKADVNLTFELSSTEKTHELKNIVGHIFVKSPYESEKEEYTTEDSYLGFFKIDSLKSNSEYRPNKYKGYAQFREFNATHTAGLEDGMWGYFVLDVSSKDQKVKGAYVFQAGDHMGGTILVNCSNL
jgi:hypothetical protein